MECEFTRQSLIREIPSSVKKVTDTGDHVFLAAPDGACASNAAAAHIFQDPKCGPQLRNKMNNHIVDRWSFYKEKFAFPITRKVGVKGKEVTFTENQRKEFCDYLKTDEAKYIWSDSEDLQAISNMYQIPIDIITIQDDDDTTSKSYWTRC